MKQSANPTNLSGDIREGLIFIPDISGFTELVHHTDVMTGREITYELLSAVMHANQLGLRISEVEGDAILFYRYGTAPSLGELSSQYKSMKKAFEKKIVDLEERFSIPLRLELKVIAHFGPMTSYRLGPFEKLYGEVVVEAHRLLKNSIGSDAYLLLTDALLAHTAGADENGIPSHSLCEVYGSLRKICFSYVDYGEKFAKVA